MMTATTPTSCSISLPWGVVGRTLVVAVTAACAAFATYAVTRRVAAASATDSTGRHSGRRHRVSRQGTVIERPVTDALHQDLIHDVEEGRVTCLVLDVPNCVEQQPDDDLLDRLFRVIATNLGRLQRLEIWGIDPRQPKHEAFLYGIVRSLATNRGLQHLVMRIDDSILANTVPWRRYTHEVMDQLRVGAPPTWPIHPFYWRKQMFVLNHQLWSLFWEAISIHPALRVVDMEEHPDSFATSYEREFRDDCVVQTFNTNTVLTDLVLAANDHDSVILRTKIFPLLERNRFSKLLNNQDNGIRRQCLLVLAMRHPRAIRYSVVRSCVALSFRAELDPVVASSGPAEVDEEGHRTSTS